MEDKINTSGGAGAKASEGNPSPAKKAAASKAKSAAKPQKAKSHPSVPQMVMAAVKELKERKGSSLKAIRKYMVTSYKVDGEKVTPFIKRHLKAAVASGALVQTSGKGASGSFKLASRAKPAESKVKLQVMKKAASPKKAKKSVEKKTTQARKVAEKKKATTPVKKSEPAKKPAAVKKSPAKAEKQEKSKATTPTKTIARSKKAAKAPAAKTKAPKPKNVSPAKAKVAAKK